MLLHHLSVLAYVYPPFEYGRWGNPLSKTAQLYCVTDEKRGVSRLHKESRGYCKKEIMCHGNALHDISLNNRSYIG